MFGTVIMIVRLVNVGLALACLLTVLRIGRRWRRRDSGFRFRWGGIALLLVAVGYTSWSSLGHGADAAVRAVIILVALVYTLLGLLTLRPEPQIKDKKLNRS